MNDPKIENEPERESDQMPPELDCIEIEPNIEAELEPNNPDDIDIDSETPECE